MGFSAIFIHRPVATTLLMAALLLVGLASLYFLPLSALPEVDYPTIQVQTFYPGASPEVMTSAVTAPLERQFGQMPSLNQMSSQSSAGASVITLQFDLALNLDIAEQEVQAAINAAGNLLPGDLPSPPIYAKINPADAPILTIALTSKTADLTTIENLADTRLAQKLSQIAGVGLVTIGGGHRPAIRVRANPAALAALGLNIDDLRTTIGNLNVNTPKGSFDGPTRATSLDANDQLPNAAAYADAVIAYRNGAAVRLSDVATIVPGAEDSDRAAWIDRTPAIVLDIQRQPGANVIQVVDRIRALLPRLQAGLPPSIDLALITDRTQSIRASVADVGFELGLSVVLVVAVIFLFLRDAAVTLIPSLSVPLSLIGTLAVMYLYGFSLNNLSLMALTIATGFVVDDAIVMIENIARFIDLGMPPLEAALKGAAQIGFTILSLTISLIAVLIPLLFMGEVVGRLFHEFAITLAVAIGISALVSLTLVPMMCAWLLRRRDAQRGRFFDAIVARYDRMLNFVLDRQGWTLLAATATVCVAALLYVVIPKGFFPEQDTGLIQAVTTAAQSSSYAAMAAHQTALVDAVLADKDVASVTSFIGVDGTNPTLNTGRLLIQLRPRGRRGSAASIIRRLTDNVQVPGIGLLMQPVQDLTIDTSVSATQYRLTLQDTDATAFDSFVPRLVAELRHAPELADVSSDLANQGLAADLVIDRATAGRFGITPATVDNALYDAFGQRIISTIFTQASQYRVILQADPSYQASLASLSAIYLPSATATGGQVPLSALISVHEHLAPLVISHVGQFPATAVSFNLAQGASLGAAEAAISAAEDRLQLPAGMQASFQGSAAAFQSALGNEAYLVLAAILTMYIVLGVLYESFVHPVTILSTLPSAGLGAVVALLLTGSDLDVIGVIAIVLLIGIVKKNAIMMIDFAIVAQRDENLAPREAIHRACLLRLRPILMTTAAALFSALPLMLGQGQGSELRRPLGIAIFGGLVVSQALTLFTTPVIYLMFERVAVRFRRPATA